MSGEATMATATYDQRVEGCRAQIDSFRGPVNARATEVQSGMSPVASASVLASTPLQVAQAGAASVGASGSPKTSSAQGSAHGLVPPMPPSTIPGCVQVTGVPSFKYAGPTMNGKYYRTETDINKRAAYYKSTGERWCWYSVEGRDWQFGNKGMRGTNTCFFYSSDCDIDSPDLSNAWFTDSHQDGDERNNSVKVIRVDEAPRVGNPKGAGSQLVDGKAQQSDHFGVKCSGNTAVGADENLGSFAPANPCETHKRRKGLQDGANLAFTVQTTRAVATCLAQDTAYSGIAARPSLVAAHDRPSASPPALVAARDSVMMSSLRAQTVAGSDFGESALTQNDTAAAGIGFKKCQHFRRTASTSASPLVQFLETMDPMAREHALPILNEEMFDLVDLADTDDSQLQGIGLKLGVVKRIKRKLAEAHDADLQAFGLNEVDAKRIKRQMSGFI
jgi:hypothetical protein